MVAPGTSIVVKVKSAGLAGANATPRNAMFAGAFSSAAKERMTDSSATYTSAIYTATPKVLVTIDLPRSEDALSPCIAWLTARLREQLLRCHAFCQKILKPLMLDV